MSSPSLAGRIAKGKREFEDLTLIVQDLRGWIELEIPVIEDGNSFGLSSPLSSLGSY